MNPAVIVAVCIAFAAVVMTGVWVASVRLRNAGIVDVAWSALFMPIAALYGLLAGGDPLRRAVAASLMILWSARLAAYLAVRVLGHLEVEDGRYAKLRAAWGERAGRKMFWFFQFQGVLAVVLSIPVLIAAVNPAHGFRALEWLAIALWAIAVGGETVADWQLRAFKRDAGNRGQVFSRGLWRYSRHPNYFFEWLVWVAFFLFAASSPWGWTTVYAPLLMFWFLWKITGIPATEEEAVRTKGEAYRHYQRTTSAFVPWFPKTDA